MFTVDPLERNAARGHGVITCMASGNDVIVLGTSKGWVIRHDFRVGDSRGSSTDYFSIYISICCCFFHGWSFDTIEGIYLHECQSPLIF